jgi:hypothetical protein
MATNDYDAMTVEEARGEAKRLNHVLEQTGLSSSQVTEWWNAPNDVLGGFTPGYKWQGGHYAEVRELVEPSSETGPSEEEFEDFVEALLQVDPTGLSGKHRHEQTEDEGSPSD